MLLGPQQKLCGLSQNFLCQDVLPSTAGLQGHATRKLQVTLPRVFGIFSDQHRSRSPLKPFWLLTPFQGTSQRGKPGRGPKVNRKPHAPCYSPKLADSNLEDLGCNSAAKDKATVNRNYIQKSRHQMPKSLSFCAKTCQTVPARCTDEQPCKPGSTMQWFPSSDALDEATVLGILGFAPLKAG